METHGHTRRVRVRAQPVDIIVEGVVNHFESKCKIQISQLKKIENSSDSDDSDIYTINHIIKVSSNNI